MAALAAEGAVRSGQPVKVLGNGDLAVALTGHRRRGVRVARRQDRGCRRLGRDRLGTCRPTLRPTGERRRRAGPVRTDVGAVRETRQPLRRALTHASQNPRASLRWLRRWPARLLGSRPYGPCCSRRQARRNSTRATVRLRLRVPDAGPAQEAAVHPGHHRPVPPRLGRADPRCGLRGHQTCIASVEGNSVYGLVNLFSGGALLQLSIFALGIMPYITASIILQLMTVVIPRLEALKKEGQQGQAQITQYTRYLTVALAILQSTGIVALARTPGPAVPGLQRPADPRRQPAHDHRDGRDHDRRHGDDHVARRTDHRPRRRQRHVAADLHLDHLVVPVPDRHDLRHSWSRSCPLSTLGVGFFVIMAVVFVEQGQRRIPVQYAKRMVGRKMYGGTSTYIPLKVNMAGVIPVIFASSLLFLPDPDRAVHRPDRAGRRSSSCATSSRAPSRSTCWSSRC